MEGQAFLVNLGIALVAALGGGVLARLLRLPVLVGYLLAGVAIGPYTPGVFAHPGAVRTVAELGVVLLMFAVGLQFSLHELSAARTAALAGGGAQIAATIGLGMGAGWLLGWNLYACLFFGCAIALSSTAVMMRLLEERGEIATDHGRIMLGISVVQDLSLVLMAALLPALAPTAGGVGLAGVGVALAKAGAFVLGALLLASRGAPYLLAHAKRLNSRELFLLTVVSLCLVAATGAEAVGLGPALGAFIAGMVISETDYAQDALALVRPLRDVFASLFFVSIGMLLDPQFLRGHWPAVLLAFACILFGKAGITALAVRACGKSTASAVLTGLGLAQIGEFSFVLTSLGAERGLVPEEVGSVVLSAALLSILAAPFVLQLGGRLVSRQPAG